MRVLCVGDSLTRSPWGSYVDLLRQRLPDDEIVNGGHGGETVASMTRHLLKMGVGDRFDVVVVLIGTNDVFVEMSPWYPIIKRVARQPWATSHREFREGFEAAMEAVTRHTDDVVVLPPLVMGERTGSVWNHRLGSLAEIIADIAEAMPGAEFVDARSVFLAQLDPDTASGYLPDRVAGVLFDAIVRRSPAAIAGISARRGLRLTLDGVHLNADGKALLADVVEKALRARGAGGRRR